MPIPQQKKHFADLLHEAGLKATPARLHLIFLLHKTAKPLPAESIILKLRGQGGDQATVYRMLRSLKGAGLVRQVEFQHGHAHWELAELGDHHHLICVKCEKIEDIKGCRIGELEKNILQKTKSFADITGHSLELFGHCKKCTTFSL